MEPRILARYPFLKGVPEYIKKQGINLDELMGDVAYGRARAAGKRRVLEALSKEGIQDHPLTGPLDYDIEILSYPLARMQVSCDGSPVVVRRYAIAEGELAARTLLGEDLKMVIDIAGQIGLHAELEDDGKLCAIHHTDFLKHTAAGHTMEMRKKQWKLINQELACGRVFLDKEKLAALVRETLIDRFLKELPLPVTDEIKQAFKSELREISAKGEEYEKLAAPKDMGKLTVTRLPPCLRKLLAMAQAGESMSHPARFALATFLATAGMSSEEIMNLFAMAPDFKPELARYQIEHITGAVGSPKYTPPNCHTMKSNSVCFDPDSLCEKEWLQSPLYYYKLKGKKLRERDAGEKEKEENGSGKETER